MFVSEGAKEKLLEQRKELFVDQYVLPMLQEAEKLRISNREITNMIKKFKGDQI